MKSLLFTAPPSRSISSTNLASCVPSMSPMASRISTTSIIPSPSLSQMSNISPRTLATRIWWVSSSSLDSLRSGTSSFTRSSMRLQNSPRSRPRSPSMSCSIIFSRVTSIPTAASDALSSSQSTLSLEFLSEITNRTASGPMSFWSLPNASFRSSKEPAVRQLARRRVSSATAIAGDCGHATDAMAFASSQKSAFPILPMGPRGWEFSQSTHMLPDIPDACSSRSTWSSGTEPLPA
mmetsp:Transcript_23635/g.80603  ORF Transcript_23635/g.80603 Transcript_23635/m.80603 type:complete len:236 (+) Transcript_23635:237-944(+)